jgi:hypothetical protein
VTVGRWTADSNDGATQITASRNAANAAVFANLANTSSSTFRCMGTKRVPSATAGAADGPTHPTRGVRFDKAEHAASSYVGAVDLCFATGGHVPTAIDLADGVWGGLTAGVSPLWTSEHTDAPSVLRFRWLDTQPRWTWGNVALTTAGTTGVQAFSKTNGANPNTSSYRCDFFPVETGYKGPADSDCSEQGCQAFPFTDGVGKPVLWLDKADRAATTWANASRACAALGGYLPTRDDFAVAIRAGLALGTGSPVWSSDLANATNATVVKWSGLAPAFDDRATSATTTLGLTSTANYRCAWTNEVR